MAAKGIGVAVSSTGHANRVNDAGEKFLETCVRHWRGAIGSSALLVVTVDGTDEEAAQIADQIGHIAVVARVGQPMASAPPADNRIGVAANKNTGLEILMDMSDVEHLFLSDDDAWPLYPQSLDRHIQSLYPHSMICWGKSRLEESPAGPYAAWSWPRGVMLYQTRGVVDEVGGMDERFGKGGHEHAEYSRRIHQRGFTPAPFLSPASYATRGATGASALWHAEDMRKPGESHEAHGVRRAKITTIDPNRDWETIHRVMADRDENMRFVPYRARENGRSSATLFNIFT